MSMDEKNPEGGTSSLLKAIDEVFAADGVLARSLSDFKIRASQVEFAKEAARVLEEQGVLVAEAGTGTGKSFAYLIPALVSNKRCIVSTAGKALQDQLFRKDVPFLKKVLKIHPDVVVLKGRANYVCRHHLHDYSAYDSFEFADEGKKLEKIIEFAMKSKTGDKNECRGISEDDPIWQKVTSRRENCLGSECPFIEDCFVRKARERALEADLVIANHHLLLSSIAMKNDSSGANFEGILPEVDMMVVDEAHKLSDIATSFFGTELSTAAVHNQIDAAVAEIKELGTSISHGYWEALNLMVVREITDVVNRTFNSILADEARADVSDVKDKGPLFDVLENLARALVFFTESVGTIRERSEVVKLAFDELRVQCFFLLGWLWVLDPERAAERFRIRAEEFDEFALAARVQFRPGTVSKEDKEAFAEISEGTFELSNEYDAVRKAFMIDLALERSELPSNLWRMRADELKSLDVEKHLTDVVYWAEAGKRSFRMSTTPIDFSKQFRKIMDESDAAWIFTSATISVNGSFSHFMSELGIDEEKASAYVWESPFNFYEQALLWVPKNLNPKLRSSYEHSEALVEEVWPLVNLAEGRTFILCTSLAAVESVGEMMRSRIAANAKSWPVFVQGEAPKAHLIEEFRRSGNGVLVGSMSFWEGVDVKGDALRLVVLDKLPFAAPNDPVFKARCRKIEQAGGRAFSALSIPQAIIHLKQGAGRLIRSESDTGLLVICDTRLISERYGSMIVKSLPDFARTLKKERAIQFFADYEEYKRGLYV